MSEGAQSPTGLEKKKVLLVDDHPLVLQGLAQVLEQDEGLTVCGVARDIPEAMKLCQEHEPDIAVVDISLGNTSGIRLIEDITEQYKETRVLTLSMHDEQTYGERSLKAGAMGYVMKSDPPEKIIEAIKVVLAGERFISSVLKARLLERFFDDKATSNPIEILSGRELEVYTMLGKGMSTRQIAEALTLSVKTIESYIDNIKGKFNFTSIREVLFNAIRWTLSKDIT